MSLAMEALEFPTELFGAAKEWRDTLRDFLVASARLLGLTLVFPVFTRSQMPALIRGAIAGGLTLPVFAQLSGTLQELPDRSTFMLTGLMLKELLIGAGIGFMLGLPFWTLQAIGEIIDAQREIADSTQEDTASKGASSVMARLIGIVAIALFVQFDGLLAMCTLVFTSYTLFPVESFVVAFTPEARDAALSALSVLMLSALTAAGPILLLFLLSDVTVGALSRVGSQIVSQSVAPMAKNILLAIFLVLFLPVLFEHIISVIPIGAVAEQSLIDLFGDPR
ncbi:MAG: flagellar biosynthetic protein FliR [Pseudomonadota bacterium]